MVPPNDPSEWDIDFLANANGNQLVLGPPGSAPERTPITLGPAAQAALYSDLEAMICDTANKFLLQQYYDGHISQQSLDNIMNSWSAKGRPAVTEFRYDQTYQLRLIMANRRTMEFAGQAGINPVHLTKVLQDWKVIAREMTVRTFCVADSVIRKHLHDAELLLAMLDAPDPTITAFDQLNTYARSKMA